MYSWSSWEMLNLFHTHLSGQTVCCLTLDWTPYQISTVVYAPSVYVCICQFITYVHVHVPTYQGIIKITEIKNEIIFAFYKETDTWLVSFLIPLRRSWHYCDFEFTLWSSLLSMPSQSLSCPLRSPDRSVVSFCPCFPHAQLSWWSEFSRVSNLVMCHHITYHRA